MFALGTLLLLINLVGFFNYTTVEEKDGRQVTGKTRISEADFWRDAYRKGGEDAEIYVIRLTDLIWRRMVHAEVELARPTFFENYILWARAKSRGYFQWINTHKAIRLGGGLCAQQAFILNNILKYQGIESRILGISGHVLNEVYVGGKWLVADPDYNIVFNYSLREIEDNPELIGKSYLNVGLNEIQINEIKGFFASKDDNWHFKNPVAYYVWDYLIERVAIYLVWLIPIGLLGLGTILRLLARRQASAA
jgi:hypothetical protein